MGYRVVITEKLNKKLKFDKKVQKLYIPILKNLVDTDEPRRQGKALNGSLKAYVAVQGYGLPTNCRNTRRCFNYCCVWFWS